MHLDGRDPEHGRRPHRGSAGRCLFLCGTFSSDDLTIIALNSASTHDNNVGP